MYGTKQLFYAIKETIMFRATGWKTRSGPNVSHGIVVKYTSDTNVCNASAIY